MTVLETLITEQLDVWSSAVVTQSTVGRGKRKKLNLYGIKKLRELILELAVRGQLVPQDSDEESASLLLERISVENAKALPFNENDENRPPLPHGWKWAFIPQVVDNNKYAVKRGPFGSSLKKSYFVESGYKVYEQKHAIYNDFSVGNYYISEEKFNELKAFEVHPNDLIISCSGTVGKVAIAPSWMKEGIINQALLKITLNEKGLTNAYFKILFPAFYMKTDTLSNLKGTAQKNMVSVKTLKKEAFPLPPLAEQHRIVAKVDELMSLCDTLEQAQESSINAHQILVENLLNALTHAAHQGDFDQAWTRIAAHFDTLFTTEHSIDQLKQAILQLAVMGKLVPQDPQDEPASILLAKIAAEKAQLIKAKKIKKQKVLPAIGEDEKPFGLPVGWEWCRFGSLTNDIATGPFGSMVHKRDYISNGVPLINPSHMINSVIVEDSSISVSLDKAAELSAYKLCISDIVMARRGEMGRCALVTKRESDWLCGTGSFVLRFRFELSRSYILLLFKTKWAKSYLGGKSIGTTMTNLNHGILNKMPTPLPSLAEQKRIVTKVDQLLSLCDQLKSQIISAKTTQQHLADVLAKQAVNS